MKKSTSLSSFKTAVPLTTDDGESEWKREEMKGVNLSMIKFYVSYYFEENYYDFYFTLGIFMVIFLYSSIRPGIGLGK